MLPRLVLLQPACSGLDGAAARSWLLSQAQQMWPLPCPPAPRTQPSPEALTAAQQGHAIDLGVQQLAGRFDARLGGFGGAPKFPRPAEINLLLHQHARLVAAGDEEAAGALETRATIYCTPCCRTPCCPRFELQPVPLPSPPTCCSQGAAHGDALAAAHGGGRHARPPGRRLPPLQRCVGRACTPILPLACSLACCCAARPAAAARLPDASPHPPLLSAAAVDEHWHVPHFEIMTYDNPQLVLTYLSAFQASKLSCCAAAAACWLLVQAAAAARRTAADVHTSFALLALRRSRGTRSTRPRRAACWTT